MHKSSFLLVGAVVMLANGFVAAGQSQSPSPEVMATRQFESGRAFAREGSFEEALKDFQAVVDMYTETSTADNALLEIARYYLDVASAPVRAQGLLENLLEKYPLSDAAPEAQILVGRVAMTQGGGAQDFDKALASFQRVPRLFPDADVVPQALYYAAEVFRFLHRDQEALEGYRRVVVEHPRNRWVAHARTGLGDLLAASSLPIPAMEELQRLRNAWPDTPEAEVALAGITTLYRLYARDPGSRVYRSVTPTVRQGARLDKITSLAATPSGSVYYTTENVVGVLTPGTGAAPPRVNKPRGVIVDETGELIVMMRESLQPRGVTRPVTLVVPRPGREPEVMKKIQAAVVLGTGDWLVMDEDGRAIHRFTSTGSHIGQFASMRARRLAVNGHDDVAAIARDRRQVMVYDRTGTLTKRLELRTPAYEIRNPEDLTYDRFGHLYVLDREGVFIFDQRFQLLARVETDRETIRRATALTVDDYGKLYVADERAKQVYLFQ